MDNCTLELSIGAGELAVIAEIIRAERGAENRDYDDAVQEIRAAVLRLKGIQEGEA